MTRPRETLLRLLGKGLRFCLSCLGSLTLWILWTVLIVLLGAQAVVLLSEQVPVPGPLLRRLESRLAEAGMMIETGRLEFDPTGRLLIGEARLLLDTPREAVLTAGAITTTIDPLLALGGHIELKEVRLTGASLWLPAMFSPRGETEAMLEGVDAHLRLTDDRVFIDHLSGRVAGVSIFVSGEFLRPRRPRFGSAATLPRVGELIRTLYLPLARRLAEEAPQIARLDSPTLVVDVRPGPAGGFAAEFEITATRAHWPLPDDAGDLQVERPAVHGAVMFGAGGVLRGPLAVTAARLEVPPGFVIEQPALRFDATALATWQQGAVPPAVFAARTVRFAPWQLAAPSLTVGPAARPGAIAAELVTGESTRAVHVAATLDPATRAGSVVFGGPLPLTWIEAALARQGRTLAGLLDFSGVPTLHGQVELGPGGKPVRAQAHFASGGPAVARRVAIDDAAAALTWSGTTLRADDIELRAGESGATGSYEMDTETLEHRFLLSGGLRPEHINGWFSGWWPRLWRDFEFPGAVASANIDIRGRWRAPRETVLFCGVDAREPIVRSVPLERAQLQVFVRPGFFHVTELFAERPEGEARGWFSRRHDEAKRDWSRLELDLQSTFTTAAVVALAGDFAGEIAAPLGFDSPPALQAQGWATGPAAPEGEGHDIHFVANSRGPFRLAGFPLETVALRGHSTPELLELRAIDARFAGGHVTGQANLTGDPDDAKRRLAFDLALEGAEFTRAARILTEYLAARRGEEAPPESEFMKRAAGGRLDLTASAEGGYLDTLSYRGEGITTLTGTNLGQINLLGRLSQVLRGTFLGSLDLSEAQARFVLARERVEFPRVRVAGRSAVIDARGTYRLDNEQLDFSAKVAPFREAGLGLGSALGLMLTPFTKVLEVRLGGTLDQPEWHLALGSTDPSKSAAPGPPFPPGDSPAPPPPTASSSTLPPTPPTAPPLTVPHP